MKENEEKTYRYPTPEEFHRALNKVILQFGPALKRLAEGEPEREEEEEIHDERE